MPHAAVEEVGNGNHHDLREDPSERPDEATKRALDAVPEGRQPVWYARTAAVMAYKSAESAAASFEMSGQAFGAAREARDAAHDTRAFVTEYIETGKLKSSMPPKRDQLPSLVDVNELERLPPTHDGQPRYGMTSGQMQAVIEQKVQQRIDATLERRDLQSAAAPFLFVKGKFFPAIALAGAAALGAGIITAIKAIVAWLTNIGH
jgi:hypothetical protein